MSANVFRGLDPALQPYAQYLYDVAVYYGLRPRVTSVFRSWQKQAVLYDRYRRGMSVLPAAPPGRSLHQYGLAFDLVSDDLAWMGKVWKSMGGKWYPSDPVHFEV